MYVNCYSCLLELFTYILKLLNNLTSTSFQPPYRAGMGLPACHPTAPEQLYIISQPHANLKAVVLVDMHQISHTRYDKLHTYMIINHNGINTQERLTLPANYVRLPPLLNKERKQDGGLSLSNYPLPSYACNTVRPPSNPPF